MNDQVFAISKGPAVNLFYFFRQVHLFQCRTSIETAWFDAYTNIIRCESVNKGYAFEISAVSECLIADFFHVGTESDRLQIITTFEERVLYNIHTFINGYIRQLIKVYCFNIILPTQYGIYNSFYFFFFYNKELWKIVVFCNCNRFVHDFVLFCY